MQSSLSPVQSPMPSRTANAAGEPSVQVLQSARISVSLVGSKLVMMGLIFRPLIPPLLLIWLTKSSMALLCSPNSASSANPSLPASELSDTSGKTTLILCALTPRDEVLAEINGEGPVLAFDVDTAVVDEDVEEALAPQAAVPRTTAPTTRVRITVERGRRALSSRDRISLPIGFQQFSPLTCIAPSSVPTPCRYTHSAPPHTCPPHSKGLWPAKLGRQGHPSPPGQLSPHTVVNAFSNPWNQRLHPFDARRPEYVPLPRGEVRVLGRVVQGPRPRKRPRTVLVEHGT